MIAEKLVERFRNSLISCGAARSWFIHTTGRNICPKDISLKMAGIALKCSNGNRKGKCSGMWKGSIIHRVWANFWNSLCLMEKHSGMPSRIWNGWMNKGRDLRAGFRGCPCFGEPFPEMQGNIVTVDYRSSRRAVR